MAFLCLYTYTPHLYTIRWYSFCYSLIILFLPCDVDLVGCLKAFEQLFVFVSYPPAAAVVLIKILIIKNTDTVMILVVIAGFIRWCLTYSHCWCLISGRVNAWSNWAVFYQLYCVLNFLYLCIIQLLVISSFSINSSLCTCCVNLSDRTQQQLWQQCRILTNTALNLQWNHHSL